MSKKNKEVKPLYVMYYDPAHHISKPTIVDLNTHMNWSLKECLLIGYELHITPDGKVPRKVIKNMKGIIKLLQRFVKENKQDRKDRFYTHVLNSKLESIHDSMAIFKEFVYNHLRQGSKEAHRDSPEEKDRDEKCEPLPPGTCQP